MLRGLCAEAWSCCGQRAPRESSLPDSGPIMEGDRVEGAESEPLIQLCLLWTSPGEATTFPSSLQLVGGGLLSLEQSERQAYGP